MSRRPVFTETLGLDLTANFYASEFIQEKELPVILDARKRDGLKVYKLHLRATARNTTLEGIQSFNKPDEPLNKLFSGDQDQVLADLVDEIDQIMTKNNE